MNELNLHGDRDPRSAVPKGAGEKDRSLTDLHGTKDSRLLPTIITPDEKSSSSGASGVAGVLEMPLSHTALRLPLSPSTSG